MFGGLPSFHPLVLYPAKRLRHQDNWALNLVDLVLVDSSTSLCLQPAAASLARSLAHAPAFNLNASHSPRSAVPVQLSGSYEESRAFQPCFESSGLHIWWLEWRTQSRSREVSTGTCTPSRLPSRHRQDLNAGKNHIDRLHRYQGTAKNRVAEPGSESLHRIERLAHVHDAEARRCILLL